MTNVKETIKFAEKSLEGLDPIHGLKHAKITAKFAKIIAEKENANVDSCIIAALLHDIGINKDGKWRKETIRDNHGVESAKKAKRFLSSIKLSKNETNQIYDAISQHCFPNIQTGQIAKILWDADKLNMFLKEMKSEYIRHWKEQGWSKKKIAEQIKKERRFYLKTFHTEIARKTAEENLNS